MKNTKSQIADLIGAEIKEIAIVARFKTNKLDFDQNTIYGVYVKVKGQAQYQRFHLAGGTVYNAQDLPTWASGFTRKR